MHHHVHVLFLALVASVAGAAQEPRTDVAVQRPMVFEPNVGRAPAGVRFLSRGEGYGVFVLADGVQLALRGKDAAAQQSLVLRLVDSSAGTAKGEGPAASRSHYLKGRDPGSWRTNVIHYERVRHIAAWPGIDLIARGTGRRLEYDSQATGCSGMRRWSMRRRTMPPTSS